MRGSPLGVVFPPRGVGCWLGGDRASTSLGRIVGWAGPGCAAGHACDLSALRVRGPAPGGAPPPPGLSRCPLLPPLSLHSPPGRRRAAHAQCAHVAHARASRARSRCLHGDDPAGGMAACWCALSRGVRGSGTPPVAGRPPGATPRGAAYPPATGLPPLGLQFREARVGGTACGRASLEAGAARRSCDSAARTAEPRWGGVPSWTRHGGDPCRSWGSKSQSTSCSN